MRREAAAADPASSFEMQITGGKAKQAGLRATVSNRAQWDVSRR